MIMSVRFRLAYSSLNVILSPSKLVYFNGKLHFCQRRSHDITCCGQKGYVTFDHNIIYNMTLSTEQR